MADNEEYFNTPHYLPCISIFLIIWQCISILLIICHLFKYSSLSAMYFNTPHYLAVYFNTPHLATMNEIADILPAKLQLVLQYTSDWVKTPFNLNRVKVKHYTASLATPVTDQTKYWRPFQDILQLTTGNIFSLGIIKRILQGLILFLTAATE